jgi:hypothetical protein
LAVQSILIAQVGKGISLMGRPSHLAAKAGLEPLDEVDRKHPGVEIETIHRRERCLGGVGGKANVPDFCTESG